VVEDKTPEGEKQKAHPGKWLYRQEGSTHPPKGRAFPRCWGGGVGGGGGLGGGGWGGGGDRLREMRKKGKSEVYVLKGGVIGLEKFQRRRGE